MSDDTKSKSNKPEDNKPEGEPKPSTTKAKDVSPETAEAEGVDVDEAFIGVTAEYRGYTSGDDSDRPFLAPGDSEDGKIERQFIAHQATLAQTPPSDEGE